MQFSLTNLLRISVLGFLGLSMLAVGVSRIAPSPRGIRVPCAVTHVEVRGVWFASAKRNSRWLDTETGRVVPFALQPGETIDFASCSPSRDESDRVQVVGRWASEATSMRRPSITGLARMSFPSGELIDLVETESLPVSPPCWLPGTNAHVLFAAADGQLYQHAFEKQGRSASDTSANDERPRPLEWRCARPENKSGTLLDPHLPADSAWKRIALVSFQEDTEYRGVDQCKSHLWWLRLSEDGRAVEDAGVLLENSSSSDEQRFPVVGRDQSGELVVAYLSRTGPSPWQLRTVPIALDPMTQDPVTRPEFEARLVGACRPSLPIFSHDGRWIYVVPIEVEIEFALRRISLTASPHAEAIALKSAPRAMMETGQAFE